MVDICENVKERVCVITDLEHQGDANQYEIGGWGAVSMETRPTFHKYLQEVGKDVLTMGDGVANAINRAIEALKGRDSTLAHQIIADDDQVNKQRFDIEDKCVGLVATQGKMEEIGASKY